MQPKESESWLIWLWTYFSGCGAGYVCAIDWHVAVRPSVIVTDTIRAPISAKQSIMTSATTRGEAL